MLLRLCIALCSYIRFCDSRPIRIFYSVSISSNFDSVWYYLVNTLPLLSPLISHYIRNVHRTSTGLDPMRLPSCNSFAPFGCKIFTSECSTLFPSPSHSTLQLPSLPRSNSSEKAAVSGTGAPYISWRSNRIPPWLQRFPGSSCSLNQPRKFKNRSRWTHFTTKTCMLHPPHTVFPQYLMETIQSPSIFHLSSHFAISSWSTAWLPHLGRSLQQSVAKITIGKSHLQHVVLTTLNK